MLVSMKGEHVSQSPVMVLQLGAGKSYLIIPARIVTDHLVPKMNGAQILWMTSDLPCTPKRFKQVGGDIASDAVMSIRMHDKKFGHGIVTVCMHDEIVGVKKDKACPLFIHCNKKGIVSFVCPIS